MTGGLALPASENLDIAGLSRLFDDRATSYKYFFFLALIDRIDGALAGTLPELSKPVPLAELAVDMALAAWYPHGFCRLSFGIQDQLQAQVDAVSWGPVRASWIRAGGDEWARLRDTCAAQLDVGALMRFVPFRLLRPFYAVETRGLSDSQVNGRIAGLADSTVFDRRSPYFFSDDRKSIIFEPLWLEYLSRNTPILRGWARLRLAEYLQDRNPGAPGIVSKLAPPASRESLSNQTMWWRRALRLLGQRGRCIYSGELLDPNNLSLDHYLPWSFVTHDRLWNLIPVSRSVNSAKSDKLASEASLPRLVELQHASIVSLREALPAKDWLNGVECFMTDLGLNQDAVQDKAKLMKAYEDTVRPLEALARRLGFEAGWEYRPTLAIS